VVGWGWGRGRVERGWGGGQADRQEDEKELSISKASAQCLFMVLDNPTFFESVYFRPGDVQIVTSADRGDGDRK